MQNLICDLRFVESNNYAKSTERSYKKKIIITMRPSFTVCFTEIVLTYKTISYINQPQYDHVMAEYLL